MNSNSCRRPRRRCPRRPQPHGQQGARPLQHVGRDVGRPDLRAGRQHHHGLDQIPELADVAGPGRVHQPLERLRRDPPEGALVGPGKLPDEPPDQEGDVAPPLPQRRKIDVEDVEPVVEVVPEFAQGHRVSQRPVGGGDDPHVHLDRLGAAHPEEGAALQHPEQLDLGGERDLADLVEEDGAAVGQLEPTQPPLGRPGEGRPSRGRTAPTPAASPAARRSSP